MSLPPSSGLPEPLARFLDQHAEALDQGADAADALVPLLGAAGLLQRAVPLALGGDGLGLGDAVEAIAAVAERSLAAAFVCWGQRAFIEYLVQSPNAALRARWLPALLAGRVAGATGLSNAMKFLSGIEALGVQARTLAAPAGRSAFRLDGQLPWLTNLRRDGFLVAVAVARNDGQPPFIAALPHDRAGLRRSADLDLIALRGSNTAALHIEALALDEGDVIAFDAPRWLPQVRPAFLGLQCGMSIGLTRASLREARARSVSAKAVLEAPIAAAEQGLAEAVAALQAGLADGRFMAAPVPLFELRIRLAELAMQAVQLELSASGGRAYHRDQPLGFARRWREAAFVPIVTPSLTQLQGELLKQRARQAATA